VIPRIAFVLNFNLVYNEAQERWEPDTGNESGGGALQSTTLEKTTDQTLPGNNVQQTITFQQTATDSLAGADLSNNQITVPATGEYLLTATIAYLSFDPSADLDARITGNGSPVTIASATAPSTSNASGLSSTMTKVDALSAGDTVGLSAAADRTNNATALGGPDFTHLSVTQLS